jgi:hypothetical protein
VESSKVTVQSLKSEIKELKSLVRTLQNENAVLLRIIDAVCPSPKIESTNDIFIEADEANQELFPYAQKKT